MEAYWLYIVTGALQAPALHLVQDPAHRLPREEVIPQVRYRVAEPAAVYEVSAQRGDRSTTQSKQLHLILQHAPVQGFTHSKTSHIPQRI
jgi:hypothetical protein